MDTIQILHLSDVHFGYKDEDNEQPLVTDGIKKQIKAHTRKQGLPHLLIFSGDLTQSGQPEEFIRFEHWLDSLFSDEVKPDIFVVIVPGNHEVQRPNTQSDEYLKKIGQRQLLCFDADNFDTSIRKTLLAPPGYFANYIQWHKNYKSRTKYKLISCWENDLAGSFSETQIAEIPVSIIGLNTALISFDNNDKGFLIADVSTLNKYLRNKDPDKELIITVGHHPIGQLSDEQWITDWNNKKLEDILLAKNGPHLYLHGHIHKTSGVTLNQSAGQNISILGAGACYQNKKYPMLFAYYDINLEKQIIKPITYKYNVQSKHWHHVTSGPGSNDIRAVLPLPSESTQSSEISSLKEQVSKLTCEKKKLKERLDDSLNMIENVLANLHKEDNHYSRHYFDKINIEYKVNLNGSVTVKETFDIVALDKPVHFWKSKFYADDEAEAVADISELNLHYLSNEGDIGMYVKEDFEREKGITLFFFPEIEPHQKRNFSRVYTWPNYLPHLFDRKPVEFRYRYLTGDLSKTCDFNFKLEIDESMGQFKGEVNYPNKDNKGVTMKKRGTINRFEFRDKNTPLNDENVIKLVFQRVD